MSESPIKFIATDMDGTLLNEQGQLEFDLTYLDIPFYTEALLFLRD